MQTRIVRIAITLPIYNSIGGTKKFKQILLKNSKNEINVGMLTSVQFKECKQDSRNSNCITPT